MCTAASYKTEDLYFGRTLDYEFSYGEEIVITPRRFPLEFRRIGRLDEHYAIIGMAHVAQGYPLYYDAVNECGLAVAGLNFVGNAFYPEPVEGKDNVAQFELMLWLLSQCDSVEGARELLGSVNICNIPFSDKLPCAQLHWLIADKTGTIVVESVREGLRIYDNPVGVLTNNPPFDKQLHNLSNYMGLSAKDPQNTFCEGIPLQRYSRGMGAIGLPGDLSSQSRFVRAAFVRNNSLCDGSEQQSVSQFFHILGSVDQQRGCCDLGGGKYEITIYTCCMNCDKGIYYYNTYDNHAISAVDMHREDLDGTALVCFAPNVTEQISFHNR